jgi:hypothetical protein
MVIHCALDANQGFMVAVQLVGMNWVTLDALLWRRWLHPWNFHASIRTLVA